MFMYFNFMGTWLSARFTHAACEKAEKWINKVERKVKKTRCWKHSLPIALSSCVCWEKACGTLIDLSHLRVIDRTNREEVSRPSWAASTHALSWPFFSASICFTILFYYNVKLHVIIVTLAVHSLPSSSVIWLAEVSKFSSHACSTARAHREQSQNGKEERKLWSSRFWFVLL